jgi:hypothetical protein
VKEVKKILIMTKIQRYTGLMFVIFIGVILNMLSPGKLLVVEIVLLLFIFWLIRKKNKQLKDHFRTQVAHKITDTTRVIGLLLVIIVAVTSHFTNNYLAFGVGLVIDVLYVLYMNKKFR